MLAPSGKCDAAGAYVFSMFRPLIPGLNEPYTRHIRGKIRELRVKDNLGHVRILYFTFTGKRFILLHGFLKKTDKAPEREIELAEKRMKDFIERYGGVG